MADLIDIANDEQDNLLQQSIANRINFNAVSEKECRLCGGDIPEQRRALGGVIHCIECQSALEKDLKHYRGR